MSRVRTRDEEAIRAATEVASEVHASPEAIQTGVIIGARAYRLGERKADNVVKYLAAENAELKANGAAPPVVDVDVRAVAKAMGIQPWQARRFLRRSKVRVVKRP